MNKTILIVLIVYISVCAFCQVPLQEIARFNCSPDYDFIYHIKANGDINGDGHPDLIYATANYTIAATIGAQISIYHSIPDSTDTPEFTINAPNSNFGSFGSAISYSGDINGDGIDDLVVGSKDYGIYSSGAVLIYYGSSNLSGQPDVVLYGTDYYSFDTFWLFFGSYILTDFDLNGDGYNDLIISGGGPQDYWFGHIWAFLGGPQFDAECDFYVGGTVTNENLGYGLGIGDINGDGFDDIVYKRKTNIVNYEQYQYVLDIHLGGTVINNIPSHEYQLFSSNQGNISNILADGDMNGDGYDDISFILYTSSGPRLKVIYGGINLASLTITDYDLPPYVMKNLLFYCNMNDDGYADFCIQNYAMQQGGPEYGNFLVYEQTSSNLDLSYDFIYTGEDLNSGYGLGYYLGDMNQDGYPEFIVFSNEYSLSLFNNYATILTEQYVSITDDVIPYLAEKIKIYPNPFRDNITIALTGIQDKSEAEISVYDIKGRRLYHKKGIDSDNFTLVPIVHFDSDLNNGIYVLSIRFDDTMVYSTKIIHFK
ncbi:MAG: FG-GAP-like repeat-containing protein [Candidatus Cloacimonadaceae bacterium]